MLRRASTSASTGRGGHGWSTRSTGQVGPALIVPATPEPATDGGGVVSTVVLVTGGAAVLVDGGIPPGTGRVEDVAGATVPDPAVADPAVLPVVGGVVELAGELEPEPEASEEVEEVAPPSRSEATDTRRPDPPPQPTRPATRAIPTHLTAPVISSSMAPLLEALLEALEAHRVGEPTEAVEGLG